MDIQNAGAHKMPPRAPILNLGLWDPGSTLLVAPALLGLSSLGLDSPQPFGTGISTQHTYAGSKEHIFNVAWTYSLTVCLQSRKRL